MRLSHFASALLVLLLLQTSSFHASAQVTRVIAFGDSNVDTGNLFGAIGVPGGRNSNGLLITEYVSQSLNVPLQNYAWSGATSGLTNVAGAQLPAVLNTGLLSQVTSFGTSLGGNPADAGGLYIVWAGSNDLFGIDVTNTALVNSRIEGVVNNLTQAVTSLDGLGARLILVATRTPRPDLADANNLAGVQMNQAIRGMLPGLDAGLAAQVQLFDAYALIENMVLDPQPYGFTEPVALCSTNPACAGDLSFAARYINWDAAHKTTRVHELMSGAMLAQVVPEPASVVLMGAGLAVLLGFGQRRRVLNALS